MIVFDKNILEKKFEEYHKENLDTATHIFMYSKEQDSLPRWLMGDDGKRCYVKGDLYSEAISRDARNHSNWNDAVLVGVGCTSDIERK